MIRSGQWGMSNLFPKNSKNFRSYFDGNWLEKIGKKITARRSNEWFSIDKCKKISNSKLHVKTTQKYKLCPPKKNPKNEKFFR